MDVKAFNKLGYGMYIIGSHKDGRLNGQVANTVFQVTSEPPTVAVSINRDNFTHGLIMASGVFSVSILCQATPLSFIGNFGFKSGRDTDKLEGINYKIGETGSPVFLDNTTAYIEAELIEHLDIGTHTIIVGKVVASEILTDEPCMTYEYYHQIKKGTTPKSAPSYIAREKGGERMDKYECSVCGYVYDPEMGDSEGGIAAGTPFDKLPGDWVCPICGAAKTEFRKLDA